MALPSLSCLLVLSCISQVAGHAKLLSPVPRGGPIQGPGPKLRSFDDARETANRLDGGSGCDNKDGDNNYPAKGKPLVTYTAGDTVEVEWDVTIAHKKDRKNTGVRIAVQYSDKDSFGDNILAGFLNGDKVENPKEVDAGVTHSEKFKVKLPPNKSCKACVLQWIWAAQRDGGYYLGCADIAIRSKTAGTGRRRRRRKGSRRRRRRSGPGTSKRRRRRSGRRRRRRRKPSTTTTTPKPTELPERGRRRRRSKTEPTGKPAAVTVPWNIPVVEQAITVDPSAKVTFQWGGRHNVYLMASAAAYKSCNFDDAKEIAPTSTFGSVTVDAPAAGVTAYYACEVGSHCKYGQIVAITGAGAESPTEKPTKGRRRRRSTSRRRRRRKEVKDDLPPPPPKDEDDEGY